MIETGGSGVRQQGETDWDMHTSVFMLTFPITALSIRSTMHLSAICCEVLQMRGHQLL